MSVVIVPSHGRWPDCPDRRRHGRLCVTADSRRTQGRGPIAIADNHAAPERPHAAHTQRAYAADWQAFVGWCVATGRTALPGAPKAIAGYLASLAGQLGSSGLRRRLAAIADRHRRTGQPGDPAHPLIRATLRRLVAAHTAPARPAAVLGEAGLWPLLASCGDDLVGLRDRVLFLLVQATALRRAALESLELRQIPFRV